ncbi:hypothetical protein [Gulbenkiania mobilis]|uniref:hypothetical protein n=1 Tax=Gulbenkiania mobilis TaxID=397457 RepID=UPI00128F1342|nr:hypothetical protein [Gulbenkiania mobilis]
MVLLLLLLVGGGVLYVWMQIKAAAETLGVDPEVLLKAAVIATLMIGATVFLWLKDVVEKSQALLATTAALLWMGPVRMLLNSKAELAQSFIAGGASDTPIVFWYNDWLFVWGVGAALAALAFWAWRD